MSWIYEYQKKPNYIIRPLNFDANKEKLEKYDAVYMLREDIAFVLYEIVKEDDGMMATRIVSKSELNKLGFYEKAEHENFKSVISDAMQNTIQKYPAITVDNIHHCEKKIYDRTFEKEEVLGMLNEMILSTTVGNNGALALFYPLTGRFIADKIGDFTAVCMNTTDVMIFPDEKCDKEMIDIALKNAKENPMYGDFLSKYAWHYSTKTGHISVVKQ